MAQLVYTTLSLNGSPILQSSNYSVELYQPMADHNTLEIICPTDAIENPLNNFADNVKDFVGAKITLQAGIAGVLERVLTKPSLNFMGIVTNVTINKFDGADGVIIIKAQSPTVLMSHGKDSQSFENQTLQGVIRGATKEYQEDLVKIKVSARHKETIPYTVQYKEDDFSFIKRLAQRYGEWLYYDGEQLCFGSAGGGNEELVYGQNLQNFNFSMNARPQDHTYMAYDSLQATVHNASMSQFKKDVSNPYITHVAQVSSKIFTKRAQSIYNHSLLQNGSIELESVTELKAGHALNTVTFTAQSEVPSVRLGGAVSIKGLKAGMTQTEFYGKYIVTEIRHIINSSGEYENEFSGVPRDIQVPPYYNEDAVPLCEEQYAIVKDNNDPQGLSRVRVQFPWQVVTNQLTPWVRVTTPYAGNGKGMHVLPELEEEVLVGFESGCAEKPVILGTMFHGSAKSGHGGEGNYMKGLQTAGGQRLQMNDQDGSLSLQDNGGNAMKMDGSGNMTLNVNNNKSTSVGSNYNTKVGSQNDIMVGDGNSNLSMDKAGNITLSCDTKVTLKSGSSSITLSENGDITIEGINIKVIGSANTQVGKVGANPGLKIDENVTIITPSKLDMSSGGIMTINGAEVEINKG